MQWNKLFLGQRCCCYGGVKSCPEESLGRWIHGLEGGQEGAEALLQGCLGCLFQHGDKHWGWQLPWISSVSLQWKLWFQRLPVTSFHWIAGTQLGPVTESRWPKLCMKPCYAWNKCLGWPPILHMLVTDTHSFSFTACKKETASTSHRILHWCCPRVL